MIIIQFFLYYDSKYKKIKLRNSIQQEIKSDIQKLKNTPSLDFPKEIENIYNKYSPFTISYYEVARMVYFQCFLVSQIEKK